MRTILGKGAGLLGKKQQLTAEELEAKRQHKVEKEELRKNREAIIQGLALARVVWSGGFCTDLWFFTKQSHVILGILLCHKMHPYNRLDRFLVWLTIATAGFGLSFMFLDRQGEKKDDDVAVVAGAIVSIILSVFHFVLYQAAMVRCFHEGDILYCRGAGKCLGKGIGKIILCNGIFFAVICVVGGLLYRTKHAIPMGKAVKATVLSQIYSAVLGIGFSVGMFCFYWYGCCCCNCCAWWWGNGQGLDPPARPAFCYPHGSEYPTDMEMLWGGDRCGFYSPTDTPARAPGSDDKVDPGSTSASASPAVSGVLLDNDV